MLGLLSTHIHTQNKYDLLYEMYSRMRFDSFGKGLGLDGRRDPQDVLRMQIVQSNSTGLMPFAPKLPS